MDNLIAAMTTTTPSAFTQRSRPPDVKNMALCQNAPHGLPLAPCRSGVACPASACPASARPAFARPAISSRHRPSRHRSSRHRSSRHPVPPITRLAFRSLVFWRRECIILNVDKHTLFIWSWRCAYSAVLWHIRVHGEVIL
jgi:hypothetical protein